MFEKSLALILILIISPIIIILCLVIFLSDFSNPLYFGKRIGKHKNSFYQIKLRTMKNKKQLMNIKATSTSENDPRISFIGKYLRKYKLDELPQLFNILIGNMSFIGPRPNVENEVKKYFQLEDRILSVKPGITDFSSIVFSDEGEILRNSSDPDLDYNLYIRFWKNALALIYIKNKNKSLDCLIFFLTLMNFVNRPKTLTIISKKIVSLSEKYKDLSIVCLRKNNLNKIYFSNDNFKLYV